jgi:PII-like signaling protein
MTLSGAALRLTIMVGESDQWHHRPLFTEIVHRAHAAGLAGATVLRGSES